MLSIKFNGKWLEAQVPGFQVISVSGRELMSYDVNDKKIPGIDGTTYLDSEIGARDIEVKYRLCAPMLEARQIRMNKLNSLLKAREAQLIFADELDKYFIASSAEADGSKIVFHCSDPFKYSTTEKTFQMDSTGTIMVENTGSVPVPIRYEITHNHENGYVGIASEHGAMEFGKREEADGQTYQQMEHLLSISDFVSASDDTTSKDAMHPTYGTKGTLTTKSWAGRTYLTLGTVGTLVGAANGGMRTLTIPADSNGQSGCLNWYLYGHLIMWANVMGQTGEMSISVLTVDNKLIAGLNWNKTDMSGNTAYYDFVVYNPSGTDNDAMKGRVLKSFAYQTDHRHELNPWYGDWGHVDLKKEGSKITYFYWGQYHTFNIPEIANLKAAKVQVSCKAWRASNKTLYIHGFDTLDFYKCNVSKWRDVPNRYWQGSKLEIDGNTGQFLVAGMPKPQDEILGTKWFKAEPGETEVKLYFSSFCSPKPTVVARIREAWL
ncbi:distal tail protein Dit [Faecalibaculum rodentium]|uniref:distal tail protein Dit n=3 Tax=Faecalibaculum rodentium TaxID=1702221 RepID=UPI00272CC2B6|nr:distal tail protein Dit [Faecalibaculum rodentium]